MVLVMMAVVLLIADDDSDYGVDRGHGDSGGWG